jgi:DHA3 family tetracycline resistance protein-like MFS transporter
VALVNAFVFTPMFVLIPYFLLYKLHYAKEYVGFLEAAGGIGGVLGGLIAANVKSPKRRVRVTWTYWTIGTFSALIMGFAPNFWYITIFPLIASPTMILGNVIWESMMQSEVPRELLGRAASVDWFVSLGVTPIGLVVAGQLADVIGVRTYFVAMSIITVIPGLWILSSRRINEVDKDRINPVTVAAL